MARSIPSYELYGDLLAGHAPHPIHVESIRERSSQHDWTIRVHSHRRLAQLFLFRSAGVFFNVGEVEHLTTQPTLLAVHPGIPHGFRFAEDIVGDVLSIRVDKVSDVLLNRFSTFESTTGAIFVQTETPRFEEIVILFKQLSKAYHKLDSRRAEIMAALVDLITLYLAEDHASRVSPAPAKAAANPGRQESQAQTFCMLLEENFHHSLAVSDYASRMGLSASHLTRICRFALDAPPNSLVRRRRILEAKRLLEYTSLPLSEIAHRSGFRDTAFFSRTFRSLVGVSPNAYRFGLNR